MIRPEIEKPTLSSTQMKPTALDNLSRGRSITRALFGLITAGLALIVIFFGFSGCSEDESCPICPEAPFSIAGFFLSPDTVWVGDTLRIWVDVTGTGSGLKSEWFSTTGSFVYEGAGFAMWKAPDTPVVTTINVIVYNDEANTQSEVEVTVIPYLPRNEPAYMGGGKCGLTCHGVGNHGENHDSWVATPHSTTMARLHGNSETESSCFDCHAVGTTDTNDQDWPLNNGGYDEAPIASLEGVQCESCHGPLADRYGNVLPNHGEMAKGDFLLDPGSPEAPLGCGRCHDQNEGAPFGKKVLTEWTASAHASSHLAPESNQAECSVCHTAQGFIQKMHGSDPTSAPLNPMPITCAACHDPHEHTAAASIRGDYDVLCRRCHSDTGRDYPDEPHSPQFELLTGSGGYTYGQEMENTPHSNILDKGCVTCHYAEDNDQGHTFEADPSSCKRCHLRSNGRDFRWATEMAIINSKLVILNAELDAASAQDQETDAYKQAYHNARFIEADRSLGAHNNLYALQLLEMSIENFEPSR